MSTTSSSNKRKCVSKESITIPSDTLISKIIQHSKEKSSPRLLKYLLHAKKSFSSSNLKQWKDLRTKGGLQAIETVVRSFADVDFNLNKNPGNNNNNKFDGPNTTLRNPDSNENGLSSQKDVCIASLSVLGNAYSLDYAARKEVGTNGFIQILHKFLQMSIGDQISTSFTINSSSSTSNETVSSIVPPECDISTKAVKCIANLSHDSSCRDIILRSGVGISILKILERFNEVFMKEASESKYVDRDSSASETVTLVNFIEKEDQKECIRACVRAIRILSSGPICNEEAKNHLIRFGAVLSIGSILSWSTKFASQDDLSLDIIRALTSLTDRIRLLPSDQIEELVSEDSSNTTLQKLVAIFESCSYEGKLFYPAIRCLTNLSCNLNLAESFGRLHIFKILLEKLKQTPTKASSEICRLLVTLTKHSSVNQCVLNNQCSMATLNILKSSDLEEYHRWILHVYENVYEGSLKSLLRNGLAELIHDHLKEELEDCDYEILKRKIMSMEDDCCRVHLSSGCQFVPVYRCDSPSYQQVQEEVKTLLRGREEQHKMDAESSSSGVESSSPSSSPARSWTSDDSASESGWLRARSPNSSGSEDEGCYSPVYSQLSSPTYSETSQGGNATLSDDETTINDSFSSLHPVVKRPRIQSYEEHMKEAAADKSHHSVTRKSSENIKAKSKKIVSMLNILHKSTYLNPMPQSLSRLVPMLLSFIVRGIVSLTPQRDKYEHDHRDVESINLGKQSFSLAYRILKSMCLNISMFPEFVKSGAVSIIFRLLPWDKFLIELGSNQNVENLLGTLSGKNNETAGWREGFLLRTLLISKCENELNKIALVIPLLFRKNDHVLRNFESKGNGWSRVFELVAKTDEINFSQFQDCILSVSALCETIGMKWTDANDVRDRPLLYKTQGSLSNKILFINTQEPGPSLLRYNVGGEDTLKVDLELDDGSRVRISKEILTKASPVFSAMFDGHFIETGLQKVRIRDVSKEAIQALLEQIILQNSADNITGGEGCLPLPIESDQYELSTLFELISLSDQFLLEGIYERTLNSLLCYYICPFSAPIIYAEAVKLSALWKPQSRLQGWKMDLTFVILKYLLVGDLSMTNRCGAFRKIFDTVTPSVVVGDMRALVEYYCTRPPTNSR